MIKIKKKVLVMAVLVFTLILLLSVPSFSISGKYGVYLTNMTTTSVTLTWFTDVDATGLVRYGMSRDSMDKIIQEEDKGMVSVGRKHTITLTGLSPGTKYYYEIENKEVVNLKWNPVFGGVYKRGIHDFKTFDTNAPTSTFYFLTDVKGNVKSLNTLLELVRTLSSDFTSANFVAYGGDQFAGLNDKNEIPNTLLVPSKNAFSRYLPIVYARGDEDYLGLYASKLSSYLLSKPSDKFYFGFNQGQTAIAVLDTGVANPDLSPQYKGLVECQPYRKEEFNWLQKYVGTDSWKKSQFKVAIMHNPSFGYADDGDASEWKELLSGAGTNLILAGHNLKYAHYYPSDNGESGHKLILAAGQVAKVTQTSSKMTVTVYDIGGAIIDNFTVSPANQPYTNLASGKKSSSSSTNSSKQGYGNDGDITTAWKAASGAPNQWYQVDLDSSRSITGVGILWESNEVHYKYKVEASNDNTKWETIVNSTDSANTSQYQSIDLNANGRYVRITVTSLDAGGYAGIKEFKVFGK